MPFGSIKMEGNSHEVRYDIIRCWRSRDFACGKDTASLAVQSGLDVKLSEIHGMAQRGGSVITHVRMGKNVHAPVISLGSADFVLAFEWLEALRATPYLKEDGVLIASNQKIMPITVITGSGEYPSYDNNAL